MAVLGVLSGIATGKVSTVEALIFSRQRMISDSSGTVAIVPDVVISEEHLDEVVVTRHPVDTGANVADHAYKQPSVLSCRFGWSDNSSLVNSMLSGSFLRGITTTQKVYEQFLKLMNSFELLTIKTGKRQYKNMLLTSLQTTSNGDTENALILDARFEEVLTATAVDVQLQPENMADASSTSGKSSFGLKSIKYAGTANLSGWVRG